MYKMIEKSGNTYFVSTSGSAAIVRNVLYVDGKKAIEGIYTFPTTAGDKVITVDANGEVISHV
jgi:hypothetical protein